MNYGGRDEILRAFMKIFKENEREKILLDDFNEDLIARHLDTNVWGDPELMIRTSGELRVSNFLLWQMSYTEIYITDVPWPEFTPTGFLEAVLSFQKRSRRIGGGEVCERFHP